MSLSELSEKSLGSSVKSTPVFDGSIDSYGNNMARKGVSMDSGENVVEKELKSQKIEMTSDAFVQGGSIPSQYTCEGADVSPPLRWDIAPVGTESIVLLCDDPDAPMSSWTHWVVFNLPPETTYLPEKAMIEVLGGIEGVNSWGNASYGGPCPPSGEHRYFFMLYMLSKKLDLDKTATKEEVLSQVHARGGRYILGEGQLMGRHKKHG